MSVPANRLLKGLPRAESRLLEPLYEPLDLVFGDVICRAGEPIRHAIFPHTGVVSIVAGAGDDALLELGLVGAEGALGLALVLGDFVSDVGGIVQADGQATQVAARPFVALLAELPVLRQRLLRHTRDHIAQIARTAICNTFHTIEQRTARWVLTMADRTHTREIRMTQAFLAGMLGVRRPAISQAASRLLEDGLIDYSRGVLEVLDREGLERAACGCYRATAHLYR